MVTTELEELLESVSDAELLRLAIKHLKAVYLQLDRPGTQDDAQEALDFIYMECSKRGKEWIFDKAQDACLRQGAASCSISGAEHEGM